MALAASHGMWLDTVFVMTVPLLRSIAIVANGPGSPPSPVMAPLLRYHLENGRREAGKMEKIQKIFRITPRSGFRGLA
jgi:hypothetical protein